MNIRINRGFTLIELLIVVAIIAILAAIAIPNFLAAQTRSKVSRAQAEFRTIATALESYYVDNNSYPWYNQPFDDPVDGEHFLPTNLTTPVAYISSLFNEIFPCKGTVHPPGTPVYHPYHYLQEHQSPGEVIEHYAKYHLLPYGTGASVKWMIRTPGPDLICDHGEIPYDPTNGIISRGDIARFGP